MTSNYTQEEILASLHEAHRRLEECSAVQHEAIAIIGMSCRFPGSVASPADYWQLLREGRSGLSKFSDKELRAAGQKESAFGRADYVRVGAVLDDIEHFDAAFFGMQAKDVEAMDPQHRLLLQGVWEALEDAGYGAPEHRGEVGLFGGCSVNQYFLEQMLANARASDVEDFQITGNEKDYLVSKIAYLLNLKGPVVNIQSACSTSLVAAHYAVQSLRLAECDIAVAGGVSVKVPHRVGYWYRPDGIRSLRGECRAFDQLADGAVLGNGMGLVVLKPLHRALRDNDHIYAVIRGSAVNNDGDDKVSFTAPSVNGQEHVIVRALENAQVDPSTVHYLEAHGTGTRLGDPIEVAAASKAFGRWTRQTGFCALASVKSNIGHADAAAGVAGLIKVALAIHHRQIPPTLNYDVPNAALSLSNSPFYVNTVLRAWPDGIRRAAVSSFGIGGTNSHMVLEQAPETARECYSRKWCVVPVSARNATALTANELRLRRHLETHPELNLANVAHTLALGRKAFSHRSVIVARDAADCIAQLARDSNAQPLRDCQNLRNVPVVFLFPGCGAELDGWCRHWYESQSSYRQCVDDCLKAMQDQPLLSLARHLNPPSQSADAAAYRVCLLITEYALARMWMAHGVQPRHFVGHGVGEYAAAILSGRLSVRDALAMVAKPSVADAALDDRRFADAIKALLQERSSMMFLEMGPGTALSANVRSLTAIPERSCIASLPVNTAAQADHDIYGAIARLWLGGVDIDWKEFYAGAGCRRVPLPTYEFEQQRYWMDAQPAPPAAIDSTPSPLLDPAPIKHGCCYLPVWKRMPFIVNDVLVTAGTCLFFDDGSQLAEVLKSSLTARDIKAVIVTAGRRFTRMSSYEYVIDAHSEADYQRLVEDLVARNLTPRMMLHLWSIGPPQVHNGQGTNAELSGFWSLYCIVKAWTRLGVSVPLRTGVLSSSVENVSGGDRVIPEKSLVLGACQAMQHELVNGRCRHFDIGFSGVPSRQTLQSIAAGVVDEILSEAGTARVAYRDTHRWVMDFAALELARPGARPGFVKDGGIYWITGGLGGIGMELADFLTLQARVTVVLIQRSPFPQRQEWSDSTHLQHGSVKRALERIKLMESRGSRVAVERADVRDAQALRELYAKTLREHGGLHGIVHAAGVPGGGLLALKSRADIEAVLAPKVQGTRAIQAALESHAKLDFFVLCSSVTAFAGGAGRSDYCAANCFLDAFATECHRRGDTAVLSINWDAWRHTGMAVADAGHREDPSFQGETFRHPLLERRWVVDGGNTVFSTSISEATHWEVRDHRIFGVPTLPGVAYIEMMAAALLRDHPRLEIQDLRFIQPLSMAAGSARVLMEMKAEDARYRIRVLSISDGIAKEALLHAEATATPLGGGGINKVDLHSLMRGSLAVDLQGRRDGGDELRDAALLQLGPAWNIQVESCHANGTAFLACLSLPNLAAGTPDEASYLHVALFDAATSYAIRYLSPGHLYLPVGYEKLRINRRMPRRIYSHVTCLTAPAEAPEVMRFDIRMFDTDGEEIVSVSNFAVKRAGTAPARQRSAPVTVAVDLESLLLSHRGPHGLAPDEGVRAFSQAVGTNTFAQIVVSAGPSIQAGEPQRVNAVTADAPDDGKVTKLLAPRPELAAEYVEPADDLERALAQTWQAMLGIERVGIDDDYVELGGDSLVATRLVDRIAAEHNVSMSIVTLYDRPTVRSLAQFIRAALSVISDADGIDPDTVLLRKAQARKEFLSRERQIS